MTIYYIFFIVTCV